MAKYSISKLHARDMTWDGDKGGNELHLEGMDWMTGCVGVLMVFWRL